MWVYELKVFLKDLFNLKVLEVVLYVYDNMFV